MGELDAAVYTLVAFDLCSKPTEALWIATDDVLDSIGSTQFKDIAVLLSPFARGAPSAVGTVGEALQLTTGRMEAAGIALTHLAAAGGARREEYLFQHTYASIGDVFSRAAVEAGVGRKTFYESRHGGVGDDALLGVDYSLIKGRGRWASDRSVARYKKNGTSQQSWNQVSARARNLCFLGAEVVLEVLADPNKCPPLPYRSVENK